MLFGRKNKKPKAGWDAPVQAEALTPLEEYQKRPGFNGNDVLQLAIDLCRALEAREREGILHGDVRPENIYVTRDGVFQLGGAGTAVESAESAETAAGKAAAAAYMAPEVWKGGPDSTTAGLYSLGLVLYQLLNGGRLPFWPEPPVPVTGQDQENAFARRMNGESFPVPTRAGGPLARIILRACEYDRNKRYQSPEEMRWDLEFFLAWGEKQENGQQQLPDPDDPETNGGKNRFEREGDDPMPGTRGDGKGLPAIPRPKTSVQSRFTGCLLGGAVGDALGYPVEFQNEAAIFDQYGPSGIQTLEQAGNPAVISDDTQMTLFAANAIVYYKNHVHAGGVIPEVWLAYREWLGTQGNVSRMEQDGPKMWIYSDSRLHACRAPGNTCLSAIRNSPDGGTMEEPVNNSKGCGTVMRAAPYGLAIDCDPQNPTESLCVKLACEDAALTHGHPLAWGSSGWLAGCVFRAVQDRQYERLEDCMKISLPREVDPTGKIDKLTKQAIWLANEESLSDLAAIHALGEGWVAEEALAIAVFCAVRYQDDFAAAIRAAVNHKGDSDSTGAICGNILGAWLGKEAVEQAFSLDHLELRDVIETMAEDLYRVSGCRPPKPGEEPEWDRKYRSPAKK